MTLLVIGNVVGQRRDRNLELPSGWSDTYFERLDEGRSPKTIVAVMDFSGGELLEERVRFRMSDMLITPLVQAGRFDVVERERLDAVFAEQNLQRSAAIDPTTAVRIGRLLGAELVVFGLVTQAADQKIDRFSYDVIRVEVGVEVRGVNTETGQVIISRSATGVAEDRIVTTASGQVVRGPTDYDPLYLQATVDALEQAAQMVSYAAPLIGFVVNVQGDDVMIDLGESRGVSEGDSFVVFRRGEEIVHPVSGDRIGWNKSVLAEIEIQSTQRDLATGEIVTVVDRDVQLVPGDIVFFRAPSGN
ncbi:MAG: CsgG/HfaB family protein [Gemmatimonadota bacterium]|nr:CsgG/HfaB family protein [Gemmatimonadota bacterium]